MVTVTETQFCGMVNAASRLREASGLRAVLGYLDLSPCEGFYFFFFACGISRAALLGVSSLESLMNCILHWGKLDDAGGQGCIDGNCSGLRGWICTIIFGKAAPTEFIGQDLLQSDRLFDFDRSMIMHRRLSKDMVAGIVSCALSVCEL